MLATRNNSHKRQMIEIGAAIAAIAAVCIDGMKPYADRTGIASASIPNP